ncbi:MAG: amidohydrolase family protein [Armatimonadetes bacterium]|nr:amidohydrolase family protein [Armatimonadota bacterium]
MIDFHVHMGNLFRYRWPHRPLTVHQLIDIMDRHGIEIGVLLPCESPEAAPGYFLTEDALRARDTYPDRLIAFASVDPRMPNFVEQLEVFINQCGCAGIGEVINSLPFDDPRNKAIYAMANDLELPVVFDMNRGYCWDDPHLPRLEACLQEFPKCIFVGHGPAFWAAISGDYRGEGGYPTGPIQPGGAVDRLLAAYPNLYADLSAHSGYNAVTRDPEFAFGFVQRHFQKLLFGTDIMGPGWELKQVEWLRSLDVPQEVKSAIAHGNARRLLRLG